VFPVRPLPSIIFTDPKYVSIRACVSAGEIRLLFLRAAGTAIDRFNVMDAGRGVPLAKSRARGRFISRAAFQDTGTRGADRSTQRKRSSGHLVTRDRRAMRASNASTGTNGDSQFLG